MSPSQFSLLMCLKISPPKFVGAFSSSFQTHSSCNLIYPYLLGYLVVDTFVANLSTLFWCLSNYKFQMSGLTTGTKFYYINLTIFIWLHCMQCDECIYLILGNFEIWKSVNNWPKYTKLKKPCTSAISTIQRIWMN